METVGEHAFTTQPFDVLQTFAGLMDKVGSAVAAKAFDMRLDFTASSEGRLAKEGGVIELYAGAREYPTGMFVAKFVDWGALVECRADTASGEQIAASLEDVPDMLSGVLRTAPSLLGRGEPTRLVPTAESSEQIQVDQHSFAPFLAKVVRTASRAVLERPEHCEAQMRFHAHTAGRIRFLPNADRKSRICYRNKLDAGEDERSFDMRFLPAGATLTEACAVSLKEVRVLRTKNTVIQNKFMQQDAALQRLETTRHGEQVVSEVVFPATIGDMLGMIRQVAV